MGMKLTQEQFDRECGYRVARSIMGRLAEGGLLTPKEYGRIEPFWRKNSHPYGPGIRT